MWPRPRAGRRTFELADHDLQVTTERQFLAAVRDRSRRRASRSSSAELTMIPPQRRRSRSFDEEDARMGPPLAPPGGKKKWTPPSSRTNDVRPRRLRELRHFPSQVWRPSPADRPAGSQFPLYRVLLGRNHSAPSVGHPVRRRLTVSREGRHRHRPRDGCVRVRDSPRKRRPPQGHRPRVVVDTGRRASRVAAEDHLRGVAALITEHRRVRWRSRIVRRRRPRIALSVGQAPRRCSSRPALARH